MTEAPVDLAHRSCRALPRSWRTCALALAGAVILVGCPTADEPDEPDPDVAPTHGALLVEVLDAEEAPLAGAFATVGPLGAEATSDDGGLAAFAALPAGAYRLTVAAVGFETVIVEAVDVVAGESSELELALREAATGTPALRVEARTAAGRPRGGATGTVGDGAAEAITRDDGTVELGELPTGDLQVAIVPGDDAPGAAWSAALSFEEGATTLLQLTLSGAPSDAATWAGSDACLECHGHEHAAWASSKHAATWSATPPSALAADLLVGVEVTLPLALSSVSARLAASGDGTRAWLFGADGFEVYDVLGWYGATGVVPILDHPGGPAPAPVLWRPEGAGDLASPAFEPGLAPFEPEAWFDEFGGFLDHDDTHGPAPERSEAAACVGCHALGFELDEHGGVVTSTALGGDGVALERGVGCEACHGPGSEHVAAGDDEDGGVERIVHPGRLDPERALDVCAACHSAGLATASEDLETAVAFPYSEDDGAWRAGGALATWLDSAPETWPGGAAAGPNQQADDLRASPHGGSGLYALHCTECHLNHGPSGDLPYQLNADPDDNSLCLGCHTSLHFADEAAAAEHTRHSGYDPAGSYASGRCTGCHMPATASRSGRSEVTGGGRLPSHVLTIQDPADSLAAFDAAGASQLALDDVPPNACLTCHRWADIEYEAVGSHFIGPAGEPTLRTTYVTLSAVFDYLYGEAD